MAGATESELESRTKQRIIQELKESGPLARVDIVERLGKKHDPILVSQILAGLHLNGTIDLVDGKWNIAQ